MIQCVLHVPGIHYAEPKFFSLLHLHNLLSDFGKGRGVGCYGEMCTCVSGMNLKSHHWQTIKQANILQSERKKVSKTEENSLKTTGNLAEEREKLRRAAGRVIDDPGKQSKKGCSCCIYTGDRENGFCPCAMPLEALVLAGLYL